MLLKLFLQVEDEPSVVAVQDEGHAQSAHDDDIGYVFQGEFRSWCGRWQHHTMNLPLSTRRTGDGSVVVAVLVEIPFFFFFISMY